MSRIRHGIIQKLGRIKTQCSKYGKRAETKQHGHGNVGRAGESESSAWMMFNLFASCEAIANQY